MKYSELIDFEPLTTVIKLADDSQAEKRKHNVETYVFSEKMINLLSSVVVPNLEGFFRA